MATLPKKFFKLSWAAKPITTDPIPKPDNNVTENELNTSNSNKQDKIAIA